MIYQAKELLAKLNNLTLCGTDGCGVLEWIGDDEQWYLAEVGSFTASELSEAQATKESDNYDLNTCNK